jgi:hypothetical protein
MRNQAFEVYSRRLNELINKLQQAGLGSDEVLKIVKALNKSEGGRISIFGLVARATRLLGHETYLPRASSFSSSASWE